MPRLRNSSCRSVAKNAPLPGLSTTGSPSSGASAGDDVVPRLAANQDAPHRAGRADAQRWRAALDLRARCVGEVGAMALTRVHDEHAEAARRVEEQRGKARRRRSAASTSLPSDSPNPPGSRKSRCMSMMTSAVAPRSIVIDPGSASTRTRRVVRRGKSAGTVAIGGRYRRNRACCSFARNKPAT